jgi:CspA family cold shock protein
MAARHIVIALHPAYFPSFDKAVWCWYSARSLCARYFTGNVNHSHQTSPSVQIEVSMQGTIKRIIRDRGFGFIRSTDGQEIFFHRSTLQQMNFDAIKEGEMVEFEVERGDKGPRAANVRPVAK